MRNGVQEARIEEFWTWFVHHKSDLYQTRREGSPVFDELLQRLHRIDPHLFFEVSTDSAPHELIVTVEGRRELFPLVDALVAAAPRLEDWVFIALKPAMGFGFQISYEGTSFDPRSMWFLPLESPSNPAALGLRVGVPEFDRLQAVTAKNAILVILDTALGERSAASDVQHVEVAALPPGPEDQGYIELTDLGKVCRSRLRRGRRASGG